MGLISRQDAFAQFLRHGRNSSHFVWFLSDLKFFESSEGWVFAFQEKSGVTVFALEPLFPDPSAEAECSPAAFQKAFHEMEEALRPKIALFVSVYEPFFALLRQEGFQALQVGKEPYVQLADCIPTGKSGKGVRAARNQALRSGVQVEEWAAERIQAHPKMMGDMRNILRHWEARNLVTLEGFLNAVDPFQEMKHRRYFLASTKEGGLEAFLVATPIPGRNGYFLEDLVIRPRASRGVGELLTLETMATLAESKASVASLGVVSATEISEKCAHGLPGLAKLLLTTIPKHANKFYNVSGLETFRKRFKPHKWESVYLAVKNYPASGCSDNRAWFLALKALVFSFQPRLNISFDWAWGALCRPLFRYPVAFVVCLAFTLSHLLINKGHELPEWALRNFGFTGSAPLMEWPVRSIVSDFLFFDFFHYASSMLLLWFLLRWMERSYSVKFVAGMVVFTSFFDDFVNQSLLVAPYKYLQPRIFQHLIEIKDVGPSLWIATFAGFQVCTMKRNREIAFAIIMISVLLSFAFGASRMSNLILNLNHSIFLSFGYIMGKLRFEYDRKISRQMAKQKPPSAKSVLPAQPRQKPQKSQADSEVVVPITSAK